MSIWNDIQNAVRIARHTLETARAEARQIGSLASDPMILRNMNGGQLADIKKQLTKFNAKTWQWKD
jgi:hypothetical protein